MALLAAGADGRSTRVGLVIVEQAEERVERGIGAEVAREKRHLVRVRLWGEMCLGVKQL